MISLGVTDVSTKTRHFSVLRLPRIPAGQRSGVCLPESFRVGNAGFDWLRASQPTGRSGLSDVRPRAVDPTLAHGTVDGRVAAAATPVLRPSWFFGLRLCESGRPASSERFAAKHRRPTRAGLQASPPSADPELRRVCLVQLAAAGYRRAYCSGE